MTDLIVDTIIINGETRKIADAELREELKDFAVYKPSISSSGVLSWTNEQGKENPPSINIVQAVIDALPKAEGANF